MAQLGKASVGAILASIALYMCAVWWSVEPDRYEASTIPGSRIQSHGKLRRGLLSVDSAIPRRTAVVVFQKNEADLLLDWLLYHSAIFGASRLYIIDHNSTSPPVTHALSYAQALGAHVINYDGPFSKKHLLMTDTMHAIFNDTAEVDTIIPMDVDEFLVARDLGASNGNTYTTSQHVIKGHIDALPRDGFKYKLGVIQAAACNMTNVSFTAPHERRPLAALYFAWPSQIGQRHKTFFSRDGFISTDQGNHVGSVERDVVCPELARAKAGASASQDAGGSTSIASTLTFSKDDTDCFHGTPLAVVHYGIFALSFSMWQSKMRRGAQAYGYTETSECTGRGLHYCRAIQAMAEDVEGTRLNRELLQCGEASRYYSTFVVDALMGRTGTVDFTTALELEKPVEIAPA